MMAGIEPKWRTLAAAAAVVALAAISCGPQSTSAPNEPEATRIDAPDGADIEDVAAGDAVASEDFLITELGVGPVSPGMTFAQMRAALPDAAFAFTFVNERGAAPAGRLCASRDGEPLLCARADVDADSPTAQVLWVETDNPRFRTGQGLAPGVPLAVAVDILGGVFIEHLPEGEAGLPPGEYAEFDDGPRANVLFVVSAPEGLAGDYAAGDNTTETAAAGAQIARILVAGDTR